MKVFERYTLEELQDGIGEFFWIESRRDYNKMYAPYKTRLAARDSYINEMKDPKAHYRADPLTGFNDNEVFLSIHALEVPFEQLPLFSNSGSDLFRGLIRFRLEKGK